MCMCLYTCTFVHAECACVYLIIQDFVSFLLCLLLCLPSSLPYTALSLSLLCLLLLLLSLWVIYKKERVREGGETREREKAGMRGRRGVGKYTLYIVYVHAGTCIYTTPTHTCMYSVYSTVQTEQVYTHKHRAEHWRVICIVVSAGILA